MNVQDESFVPLGQHLIRIEGDTLFVVVRGMFTGEDGQQLVDHLTRARREHGIIFVIYDSRHCTGIDANARRLATYHRGGDGNKDIQVAFGVPYAIRVIISMIHRAQRLLLNQHTNFHTFANEKECRAFIEKERARIRGENGLNTSL